MLVAETSLTEIRAIVILMIDTTRERRMSLGIIKGAGKCKGIRKSENEKIVSHHFFTLSQLKN